MQRFFGADGDEPFSLGEATPKSWRIGPSVSGTSELEQRGTPGLGDRQSMGGKTVNKVARWMTETDPASVNGITRQPWSFVSFVLETRLANALRERAGGYAIYRQLGFSARADLDRIFDTLALGLGWHAYRIDETSLLLEADGVLISGDGTRKPHYCTCKFDIWTQELQQAHEASEAILARVSDLLIREPMISISWYFLVGKGDLHCAHLEEIADDVLHDEAYPDIHDGVSSFIRHYLDATEPVLVLQGPPGTGKTRLIRMILAEIARRNSGKARVLFTGDKRALEGDEIFVKFLTGSRDAFVVEDADHLLQPRANGNDHLHRFLTAADGIVRAQGRKIIFSTNLPNVGDLDEALVRPGRCFARTSTRKLSLLETRALQAVLGGRLCDAARPNGLMPCHGKGMSLAEIYKSIAQADADDALVSTTCPR